MRWEINGSKGTLVFDPERQNELLVHFGSSTPGDHAQGFRNVLVSEAYHPYWEHWWPHGHMIGWEDNFVHELLHLLTCIKEDTPIGPRGATLRTATAAPRSATRSCARTRPASGRPIEYRRYEPGSRASASSSPAPRRASARRRRSRSPAAGARRRLHLPQRDRGGGADGRRRPRRRPRGDRPAGRHG